MPNDRHFGTDFHRDKLQLGFESQPPESSHFKQLLKHWTPVFTGETTFSRLSKIILIERILKRMVAPVMVEIELGVAGEGAEVASDKFLHPPFSNLLPAKICSL
jgi:hypothetical protein